DLGRGDWPPLFRALRVAPDQCSGDVIAIAALALGRPLHIQRLAAFIEQLACQRTARRFGLAAFATAHPLIAQPLLDAFPKLAADDRLVLSGMAFVLVPDLAYVDRVGEQVVQRSA